MFVTSVRDQEEAIVGEYLADGLVIVDADIPLDRINNVTVKIVGAARRFMVVGDCPVEKRSFEVSMREVRDQGSVGIVRTIIVVVVVDGV